MATEYTRDMLFGGKKQEEENINSTETSNKILSQLGINEEASKEYDTIKEFGKTTSDLKVIEKGEPIFLRLDANEEIEYIKNKMKE